MMERRLLIVYFGARMRGWYQIHRYLLITWQSALCLVLTSAILLASTGVPVLSVVPKVPTDTPFPCQSHRCGCRDASSLWGDCCCYTLEQKVAWARERGIAIPSFVETKLASRAKCSSTAKSCCSAKPKLTKLAKNSQANVQSSKASVSLVNLDDYHRCKTGSEIQRLLAHALPVQRDATVSILETSTPLVDIFLTRCESASNSPDTPPPRCV